MTRKRILRQKCDDTGQSNVFDLLTSPLLSYTKHKIDKGVSSSQGSSFSFTKSMLIMSIAAIFMISTAHGRPIVEGGAVSSGFLYGIGYREQELQQAKSEQFSDDTVGTVD